MIKQRTLPIKMSKTQLIPMRFVVMIGHLVLLILFLTDQDNKGKCCLQWNEIQEKEISDDYKVTIGILISISLISVEFFGFLSGLSMFFPAQNLFSFIMHSSGCILFSYFITEIYESAILLMSSLNFYLFYFLISIEIFDDLTSYLLGDCSTYWYIFTFFSLLPFFTEILIILRVIVLKLPY